jgi:ATP-dependent Lon protease
MSGQDSESDYSMSENEYSSQEEITTTTEEDTEEEIASEEDELLLKKIFEDRPIFNINFGNSFQDIIQVPTTASQEHPDHILKKIKLERKLVDEYNNESAGINNLDLSQKILLSKLSTRDKSIVLKKIEDKNLGNSDKSKTLQWANCIASLPLNVVKSLPVDNFSNTLDINNFLLNSKKILDETLFGMNNVKEEILDFLSTFITNPDSRGSILGLHGKPGLGKTKICRALAKILSLPFFQISFGGLSDASILLGHDSTYIGSKPGIIVKNIKEAGCINPVICLDEIDKINSDDKSSGVSGVLTHLLDETQNHEFKDLYLDEIHIDLSKALFIATFNDISKIDPIVLNRIKVIPISELTTNDKISIVSDYIIPEFNKEKKINLKFPESIIEYIISRKTIQEAGMRKIRSNIESIFRKINTVRLLKDCPDKNKILSRFSYENLDLSNSFLASGEILVTKDIVDTLLKQEIDQTSWMSMYI